MVKFLASWWGLIPAFILVSTAGARAQYQPRSNIQLPAPTNDAKIPDTLPGTSIWINATTTTSSSTVTSISSTATVTGQHDGVSYGNGQQGELPIYKPNVTTIVTITSGNCAVTVYPSQDVTTVTVTVPGETITVDPQHPPAPTETQTIILPSSCTRAPTTASPPIYGSVKSNTPLEPPMTMTTGWPVTPNGPGTEKTATSPSNLGPIPTTVMGLTTVDGGESPTGQAHTPQVGHPETTFGQIHGVTITATMKTPVYTGPTQVPLNFGPLNPGIKGVPAQDGSANPGAGAGESLNTGDQSGSGTSPIGPQNAGIVNSVPVSIRNGGKVVIGGSTFDGLAPTINIQTVDGQTFSILPSGSGVVAPGGMIIVGPTAAITPAPPAPTFSAMTVASIGVDIGTGLGVVGGHTVRVGAGAPETAVTIGFETIRAGPAGLMFASTTIAPLAPLTITTIDGVAFTIGPDYVVMSGHTYSFASPTMVDVGTETISIGTDGIILPSTTISRPPKATGDSDEHNSAAGLEVTTRWSIILTIFTGIIALL